MTRQLKPQVVDAPTTLEGLLARCAELAAQVGYPYDGTVCFNSLEPNATASDGRHYAFQCWVDLNDENDKQLADYGPYYGDTLIDVFTSLYNDLYNSCENRVVELARVVWPGAGISKKKKTVKP